MNLSLKKSDTIGAIASTLCVIHCLMTPMLFAAQSYIAVQQEVIPFWWKNLDFLFVAISLFYLVLFFIDFSYLLAHCLSFFVCFCGSFLYHREFKQYSFASSTGRENIVFSYLFALLFQFSHQPPFGIAPLRYSQYDQKCVNFAQGLEISQIYKGNR